MFVHWKSKIKIKWNKNKLKWKWNENCTQKERKMQWKKMKYLLAYRIFMFYSSDLIACYSHAVLCDTG